MLNSEKILGNSIVSYLYKKNFHGIALTLVKNLKSKFSLAIDSGNLEVSLFFFINFIEKKRKLIIQAVN